ncbi:MULTISPECIES: conjugative transposon protein TraM [Christiangramia]|uniref:Conjugative transposon protein TraM n=1 Tax=Christiangramia antarctica TaxID=2058158 RepID=A0ABW5X640_9FLAO|nr:MULTISPECIES: conjugative transposon protein TraM [unclassified Christiangramia]MCM4156174.1 conjugal transfer protein TraM [Gramella sp. AN32]WPZ00083.1 conjugative transposon protein TraM [Christiangramia sp. OXR-203]
MKIEKNKVVFGSILAFVIIFIVSYSVLVLGDDSEEFEQLKQTKVPELEEEQEQYNSKLDAINALREVRETNAPSIYDEKLIDSLGFYDPDLEIKEKERIVDSIYKSGRVNYSENGYRKTKPDLRKPEVQIADSIIPEINESLSAKEIGLEHQLFFASQPLNNETEIDFNTDPFIYAEVDGEQVVKTNSRLRMRVIENTVINGKPVQENSLIYGFISFKPNRALIEIENIQHQPVKLKAFDLQDGSEGIYVENSFRSDATRVVIGDVVEDINVAGVPQVSGIKDIFQRNNKNIKVTITNNYKLILKAH